MSTLGKTVWFVTFICAAVLTVAVLWSWVLSWAPGVGVGS